MQTLPGVLFDRESIRVLIDNDRPAVYWIYSKDDELVYFGASYTLRTRLLAHVRNPERSKGFYIKVRYCRSTTEMARLEKAEQAKFTGPTAHLCGVVRRNPMWKARKV